MKFNNAYSKLLFLFELFLNAAGVEPVIFLKSLVKEVMLSKLTETQTSITGIPDFKSFLAFAILTSVRYWYGVLP